tara:strand:+ start:257 stop:610 length:354 start_codon:yes stop_codon:yes gene_type:complete
VKTIYANNEHQVIVEQFTTMLKEFVSELANKQRWKNYNEIFDVIVEYHNNYGKGAKESNYWDWLMILPINLSVMTQGFFAAVETKRNQALIKSYKVLLNEMLHDTVAKLEKLEPLNE